MRWFNWNQKQPQKQAQKQQQKSPRKIDNNDHTLLTSFEPIFYVCKLLGLYPFDYEAFREHRILQSSRSGSAVVLIMLSVIQFGYGYMALQFRSSSASLSRSFLGNIVVTGVISLSPIILLADQLNALHKQRRLGKIFQQIDELDERFRSQQISELKNSEIMQKLRVMITLTFFFEFAIFLATFFMLPDFGRGGFTILWILNFLPTLYNTFDKIWYIGLILAMKRRFAAINDVLETLVAQHEHLKIFKHKVFIEEIIPVKQPLNKPIFWHIDLTGTNIHDLANIHRPFKKNTNKFVSELDSNYDLIEEKFMLLAQLHNDICYVARQLNQHWSIPILCLMAYVFVVTIAQLYFTYLASQGEEVPVMFVSTKSVYSTILFLIYLLGKCVTLMYCCLITKLEAKRTAICFHRCALAVNRNEIYELVNHLSLKLLNHPVNFTAGGFFTLDMSTLYGMLGALTSYLIIFIQFDLEAKQQGFSLSTQPTTPRPN